MQIYSGFGRQGVVRGAALVSLALVLSSCSAHHGEPMAADWNGLGWDSSVALDAGSADSGPEHCDEEGARIDCGTVSEHRGKYIICTEGHRTCTNGVWGPCQGANALE